MDIWAFNLYTLAIRKSAADSRVDREELGTLVVLGEYLDGLASMGSECTLYCIHQVLTQQLQINSMPSPWCCHIGLIHDETYIHNLGRNTKDITVPERHSIIHA